MTKLIEQNHNKYHRKGKNEQKDDGTVSGANCRTIACSQVPALSKDKIIQCRFNANDEMSSKLHHFDYDVSTKRKGYRGNISNGVSEILGSTQLGQICPGDFCRYDMKTYLSRSMDLNNFDEHEMPMDVDSCQVVRIRNKLLKMEHESQLDEVEIKWNDDTAKKRIGHYPVPLYDVTQSLIIRARKNKDKIDLCLRHYNKPNYKSNVILNDIWKENTIEGLFPGHYYRSVKVCSNCFQVYEFIKYNNSPIKGKTRNKKGSAEKVKHKYNGFSLITDNVESTGINNETDCVERAKLAVSLVTKSDLTEVFSFPKPPSLVTMVVSALMIVIKRHAPNWKKPHSLLLDPDQCHKQMCSFKIDEISKCQINDIDKIVDNQLFRPLTILPISKSASKICSWVLGIVSLHRIRKGTYTPNLFEPLINIKEFVNAIQRHSFVRTRKEPTPSIPSWESKDLGSNDRNRAKLKKKVNSHRNQYNPSRTLSYQKKKVNELSGNGSQFGSVLSKTHILLCADGKTRIPYEVLGSASRSSNCTNFVVCHDIFDCIDITRLLFIDTVKKNPGCQVLMFNQAGQTGSTFPPVTKNKSSGGNENILNNEFHADRLRELLLHASLTDEFPASTSPYHLVGIGNGLSIALFFATKYRCGFDSYNTLKSIVSINGFVSVDDNLAGILHSMRNSFSAFPPNRPDMPISYFSSFLFSQKYIEQISMNLALNIYTAVTNPISLEGRIRLIDGVLQNKNLRTLTKDLNIPIFAIQSTENAFVLPSNVNQLLDGFNVAYIRSSDISEKRAAAKDYYCNTDLNNMIKTCFISSSQGIVIFVTSGHAIAQEQKSAVIDFLQSLISIARDEEPIGNVKNAKAKNGAEKMNKEIRNKTKMKYKTKSSKQELHKVEYDPSKKDESIHLKVDRGRWPNAKNKKILFANVDTKEKKHILHMNASVSCESVNNDSMHESMDTKKGVSMNLQSNSIFCDKLQNESSPLASKIRFKDLNKKSIFLNEVISPGVDMPMHDNSNNSERTIVKEKFEDKNNMVAHKKEDSKSLISSDSETEQKYSVSQGKVEALTNNLSAEFCNNTIESIIDTTHILRFRKIPSISDYLDLNMPMELVGPEVSVGLLSEKHKNERKRHFANFQPPTADELIFEANRELENERKREEEKLESERAKQYMTKCEKLQQEQKHRLKKYQKVNQTGATYFDRSIIKHEKERAQKRLQSQVEIDQKEKKLIKQGFVHEYSAQAGGLKPIQTIPPTRYSMPNFSDKREEVIMESMFDTFRENSKVAQKKGFLKVEEFDRIKKRMEQEYLQKEAGLRDLEDKERDELLTKNVSQIQRCVRGHLGRLHAGSKKMDNKKRAIRLQSAVKIQSFARGVLGKKYVLSLRQYEILQLALGKSVLLIQRIWRGYLGRLRYSTFEQELSSKNIQRIFRGHIGRKDIKKERERLQFLLEINVSAMKIQAAWRIKVAGEEFKVLCTRRIASIEIQRIWRGYVGYKKGTKMKIWQETEPGPERIELGLKMINESKNIINRQREEIDTLHSAQERAEARASMICEELKKSEEELNLMENEIELIDENKDPNYLKTDEEDSKLGAFLAPSHYSDDELESKPMKQTEKESSANLCRPYNLISRQKRKDLQEKLDEIVSQVNKKRNSLKELELNIDEMEEMREMKEREFSRFQRDLMELLTEQKFELDNLRQRGAEIETATSTSANIAAESVKRAQQHHNQTSLMYNQQEELLKFQFMSMSMTYFSSLNMMKQMKNIASDASTCAIRNSEHAALASAVASAAANASSFKQKFVGKSNSFREDIKEAESMIEKCKQNIDNEKINIDSILPSDCRLWSIENVSNWLRSLSLGVYVEKFEEACVDGEFLLELRESDLLDTLGVRHKLHRRKILLSLEKIRPISRDEEKKIAFVEREEEADEIRLKQNIPDIDTVFSQARHGRIKRLESSLDLGFDINAEDERGNTVLIVAVQNNQRNLIDFLIRRGSNVNHKNCNGNTPLHFAFSYDKSGLIAEFLIESGGDDTIENLYGLTCYDGLGKDEEEMGMI